MQDPDLGDAEQDGIIFIDDKERGLHEGYLVTPISKLELIAGFNLSGTIKAVFEGLNASGKAVMTETRTLTFYNDPKLRIVDFETVIEPLEALILWAAFTLVIGVPSSV